MEEKLIQQRTATGSAATQGDTSVDTADPDEVPVRSFKGAWTVNSYDTSPIQLCVGRKSGVRFKEASAYPTQQTLLRQLWHTIVA
ncbi:hypothetical protein WJX77_000135 [Trebouxia sp. C0004]